jgi:hypothetical protein
MVTGSVSSSVNGERVENKRRNAWLCKATKKLLIVRSVPLLGDKYWQHRDDPDAILSSHPKEKTRTKKTLLSESGLAGLSAFLSAVLAPVVEGRSVCRPFWLASLHYLRSLPEQEDEDAAGVTSVEGIGA